VKSCARWGWWEIDVRLKMKEKQAVIRVQGQRYRRASKKEKGRILDEVVQLTGYHRWYAVSQLRLQGSRGRGAAHARVMAAGVIQKAPRVRARIYTELVKQKLRTIWAILDGICGKRLVAILPEIIAALEKHREIALDADTRKKLLSISAASIDRLLAPERQKIALRGRSGTKPGTLLKHQIAVRTFADWDQSQPGFVEIDLVAHEGGLAAGDFCQTLDVTDVASGWTEAQAVINKAEIWVFQALKDIRERLPFSLLGIDSDNGYEFINHHLLRYCQQQKITFTRGRPYKKNDSCFIEQKNYSIVRRAVGYARYEGTTQLELLNRLYGKLRLYTNYFQPVMKLVSKERNGAKVKKTYDRPRTPYQRLLNLPQVPEAVKERLRGEYQTLNPAALKRQITQLQKSLHESVYERRPHRSQALSVPKCAPGRQ
jgi:hypothetical protein